MANNTGNPVGDNGSEDPRDLVDNAPIIDKLANSDEPTQLDRLGRVRLTWTGIQAAGTGDTSIAVDAAARAETAAASVEADATEIAAQAVANVVTAVDGAVAQAEGFATAAQAASNTFNTAAAALASSNIADGQVFYVRTPDPQVFDVYLNSAGTAVLQPEQFDVASNSRVKLIENSKGIASGKNQFDASKVVEGFEISGTTGQVVARFDSSVSDLMYVYGEPLISVSGLQTPTAIGNYYRFLAEDGETVISFARKLPGGFPSTLAVPDGAFFFQISPRQRATDPANYDAVQVEFGGAITTYEAYEQVEVLYLGGKRIYQTPLYFTLEPGKNKFDPSTVSSETEVSSTGEVRSWPNSVTSDFIDVEGQGFLTVSGLQPNADFPNRYYVFYAEDQTTLTGNGLFAGTSAVISIPSGSSFFRFSPKQRSTESLDLSSAQVEFGQQITAFEAYEPVVRAINGKRVSGDTQASPQNWESRKLLAFGDSITETATILNDGTYTEGVRSNWPKFVGPLLESTSVMSYAESGASFREYVGQTEWQKLTHQVERSVAHGLDADIIVVAAGTNDGIANLGDYATAMSRAVLGDLDLTKTIEAMRWVFWSIRSGYPLAECFAILPIQRADFETADRQTLLDAITQMAKRYNFMVIDAHSESGIVKDFEVVSGAGRDLYDGLHPAVSGQQKMARLIASKIKTALI